MIEKEVAQYLCKQFIGNPKDFPEDECLTEAKQIHAFYKEAGYVKLAKDRSLPKNPYLNLSCPEEDGSEGAYEESQQAMLKAGFRKVELEVKE